MDLLEWIEKDMIKFLNEEYSKLYSVQEKKIPRKEEVALFSLPKDYEKEISNALNEHNFSKVKKNILELIDLYNTSKNVLGEKEKIFSVLKSVFKILQGYFNTYGVVDSLLQEFLTLKHFTSLEKLPENIKLVRVEKEYRAVQEASRGVDKEELKKIKPAVDVAKVHEFITISNKIIKLAKNKVYGKANSLYFNELLPLYNSLTLEEKERVNPHFFEVSALIEKIEDIVKIRQDKAKKAQEFKEKLWQPSIKEKENKEIVRVEREESKVKSEEKVVEKERLEKKVEEEKPFDKLVVVKKPTAKNIVKEEPFEEEKIAKENIFRDEYLIRHPLTKNVEGGQDLNKFIQNMEFLENNLKELYFEGLKHFVQGNYDEAIQSFTRVLEINPYFVPAKARLVEILNRRLESKL